MSDYGSPILYGFWMMMFAVVFGLVSIFQIAFVILKLCGLLALSWWWVMLPAEIFAALFVLFILSECYYRFRKSI